MRTSKVLEKVLPVILGVILLSGCTSTGAASSWPGISGENEIGFISYGTQVFAIDGNNGSIIWRYPEEPDNNTQFYAPPAVGEEIVVTGSFNNSLAAVDRDSGTTKWVFESADDRFISSPLVVDDFVYAPNADGYLYVLELNGDLAWRFKAGGPNWTKPLSDGSKVYFASMDHSLYALERSYPTSALVQDSDGTRTLVSTPIWSIDLGAAVVANPIEYNGSVIVGTIAGKVFSVDINSGRINWEFGNSNEVGSIWSEPVVFEDVVFVADDSGNLFALNVTEGSSVWPSPYDAGSGIIAGGVSTEIGVLFVTGEGRVFVIDSEKKPDPVTLLETPIYSTPVLINDNILLALGSREELVRAIDFNGNLIWNFTPDN